MQIRTDNNERQAMNVSNAPQEVASERAGRKARSQGKKTISAAEFGLGKGQDIIMRRKLRAQQRAMKVVTDAWNSDRKIDQNISDIREKIKCLQKDIEDNQALVDQCEQQKAELMKQYGIEDSDLELLSKQQELKRLGVDSLSDEEREKVLADNNLSPLTEEEETRLFELSAKPLEEFKQRYGEINAQKAEFSKRIEDTEKQVVAGYSSIKALREERLNFHGMEDAQKKADEIMEQASEEIIGLLVNEAKDHVDAAYEEKREEAKEKAEEKEEQEKKIEERREEKQKLEEQIEGIREEKKETEARYKEQAGNARQNKELLENAAETGMNGDGETTGVKAELKQILHKMNLLEEDLKGSAVDEEL